MELNTKKVFQGPFFPMSYHWGALTSKDSDSSNETKPDIEDKTDESHLDKKSNRS